jgi:hypothetical protein
MFPLMEVFMPDQQNNEANNPSQQGSPQQTANTPSSGNSPTNTGATSGTDEGTSGRTNDIEGSAGTGGTATQRSPETGDPGRTPGKAEGVENPEKQGNE